MTTGRSTPARRRAAGRPVDRAILVPEAAGALATGGIGPGTARGEALHEVAAGLGWRLLRTLPGPRRQHTHALARGLLCPRPEVSSHEPPPRPEAGQS